MTFLMERLPGFRTVLMHDYVAFNPDRAVEALRVLAPIEQFVRIVAALEAA